jgi:hypothetical protein
VHIGVHEAAYGGHRLVGEIARRPGAAPPAQEQADDAVVRSEVEAAAPLCGPELRLDLVKLALLEDDLADELDRP